MDASYESDFRPAAALPVLKQRAELLASVRAFFDARGYWEVETPLLSRDVIVDAHLEPFRVRCSPGGGGSRADDEWFLQTSPEFGMKRLLSAGAEAIYQVTRAFRRSESGRLHNPEFTMVEWYRLGTTYREQMELVEELVAEVMVRGAQLRNLQPSASPAAGPSTLPRPFERIAYDEAFERTVGSRVLQLPVDSLASLADRHGVSVPESLQRDDRDAWLNLLLSELVAPHLGRQGAVFLYDYPASQAALARIRRGSRPPVAERFELYAGGIELCNGYQELTEGQELVERAARQSAIRARNGLRPLPEKSRLLEAMRSAGLPECAGVALGFDRLAMIALGRSSLAEVMAFPIDRA